MVVKMFSLVVLDRMLGILYVDDKFSFISVILVF